MNTLTRSSMRPVEAKPVAQLGLSALRLNLLRALYLLMAVGLGLVVWPSVIQHSPELASRTGVRVSLLAGLGATAALGVRYPLRMLPVLIFELVWKAIFLIAFAAPLYLAGRLDARMAEDVGACLMVLIFLPVMPWRYLFQVYVGAASEPWR